MCLRGNRSFLRILSQALERLLEAARARSAWQRRAGYRISAHPRRNWSLLSNLVTSSRVACHALPMARSVVFCAAASRVSSFRHLLSFLLAASATSAPVDSLWPSVVPIRDRPASSPSPDSAPHDSGRRPRRPGPNGSLAVAELRSPLSAPGQESDSRRLSR